MNVLLSILILYIFSCLFIWLDDLIDFIYKSLDKSKVHPKKYRYVLSMQEDLKSDWIRNKYLCIYRFFNQIKEFPYNLYYEIKWFIQRGIRGYSDRDCWGVDSYLSDVIPKMLKRLKKYQHILPTWNPDDNEPEEVAQKRWDDILDNIIWTFEIDYRIHDDNLLYQKSENYSQKEADRFNNIWNDYKYKPVPRALTKKECEKYEKGWNLFRKYYWSLWD